MDKNCENIEQFNPNKKCKILIVFGDMIDNMFSNKKLRQLAIVFSLEAEK